MALCQAMDLRAMHFAFLKDLKPHFSAACADSFGTCCGELEELIWTDFTKCYFSNITIPSRGRIEAAVGMAQATFIAKIPVEKLTMSKLIDWKTRLVSLASNSYRMTREQYITHPDATPHLGRASRQIYAFICHEIGVPFLLTEMLLKQKTHAPSGYTVGSLIQRIHSSIRNGRIAVVAKQCLEEGSEGRLRAKD